MRIYLDNCCYNRPFDEQTQLRIRLETEAKLAIQRQMRMGVLERLKSGQTILSLLVLSLRMPFTLRALNRRIVIGSSRLTMEF